MDTGERNELLTRLDERTITILDKLDKLPCEKREKRIGGLEVRQAKTDERVDTHNKFIWVNITASIGLLFGLVGLLLKSFVPTGKMP